MKNSPFFFSTGSLFNSLPAKLLQLTCLSILLILLSRTFAYSQWQYPITKTVEASDTYWGVTYKDPYRWLENMKEPEVLNWFKEQADFTNATMNSITGRDELIAEWKRLDLLQPPQIIYPIKEGNRIFYQKRMPGEKVSKVYYREGTTGAEQLLFDPLTYLEGRTLSIQQIL